MARRSKPQQRRPPAVEKRARTAIDARDGGASPAELWRRILSRRLRGRLGEEIELTLTDNIHTMVSYARRSGRCRVRLHHMFLQAPPPVVDALARYIAGDGEGSMPLDRFIERHSYLIRRVPAPVRRQRVRVQPRGRHHDLQEVFDALNARYFDGEVQAGISWSTVPRVSRPRQSIKLGSYSEDTRVIRIHPALDQLLVPRYVIEYIVFHEMLHVVEPAERRGRRRVVHTERFLEREQAFPHLERARAWERRHIDWLLAWRPAR